MGTTALLRKAQKRRRAALDGREGGELSAMQVLQRTIGNREFTALVQRDAAPGGPGGGAHTEADAPMQIVVADLGTIPLTSARLDSLKAGRSGDKESERRVIVLTSPAATAPVILGALGTGQTFEAAILRLQGLEFDLRDVVVSSAAVSGDGETATVSWTIEVGSMAPRPDR